ncbi:MAG: putative membrane protein (TIGR00267 family) [Paraglaciecola sp.]|jgi:predicted membrane protein (TIGR00267 family)
MTLVRRIALLLQLTQTHTIVRRYFVVNGFDGALTMLGLILGFVLSAPTELSVVIKVCLGAAIALGVSGISSAYVSEVAERRHALSKLEAAMVSDLQQSAHGDAALWVPLLVAVVNGLAPLLISLLILLPLWLAQAGFIWSISPLLLAMLVALLVIFLLGVFLAGIAGRQWWVSGLQTLLVALATIALIYFFAGK